METVSKLPSMTADMVFTQGRGFVIGQSFGLRHRVFGNVVSFW